MYSIAWEIMAFDGFCFRPKLTRVVYINYHQGLYIEQSISQIKPLTSTYEYIYLFNFVIYIIPPYYIYLYLLYLLYLLVYFIGLYRSIKILYIFDYCYMANFCCIVCFTTF